MKIDKNSWHYRWSNFFTNQNEYNTNLCSYFWKLMFSIFFPMACVFIILGAVIVLTILLFIEPGFINMVVSACCVTGCVFLPPLAIHWYRIWTNHTEYRISGEMVVVDFIKAKKRKICPLIEFYYS